MRRLGALLVAVAVSLVGVLPSVGFVAAATTDRYIVQFDRGTDPDSGAAELTALGVDVFEVYRDVFSGVAVLATPSLIDQVSGATFVTRVEPDQVMTLAEAIPPTIVQSNATWGLDRIDQRSLPLSGSYSYNGAGAGVTAYIIDSGIRADHADFGGRVRSGFTAVEDGHGTDDWCEGHGTHVAGTVGGQTFGVAKSVSLVAVRVLDCDNSTSNSQLLSGLDWVMADHEAGTPAVANLSIGGPGSTLLDNGVQSLVDDGITVAVAAGNENSDACTRSPARAPNVLTVAASTKTDTRALFSNGGASNFGSCVDVFAPGFGITSTWFTSNTATMDLNGTSMATPHVTGAAAVMLSERPMWTPAQVARDLLADATVNVITNTMGSPNRLLFSAPLAPPTNDDFAVAAAIDLTGPKQLTATNVDATKEAGEPAHTQNSGGTSVWWSFVAPDHGTVTLSTEGSTFNTLLAAYTGDAVNALVPLASNDGAGNGSTVVVSVERGHTYRVATDGRDGVVGSILLGITWRPASFVSLVPARLLESRSGAGSVDGLFSGLGVRGSGSVTELVVAGRGGVAVDASAVVLTVTVTEPGAAGFVTVFPCGSSQPLASNVNFVAGATVANSVVSGVGVGGRVCLFTSASTHLVVDVNGFFQ